MQNQKEPISVRAYSTDILLKFSKIFPELISEIIPLLEDMAVESSTGLKSKSNKLLKAFENKRVV